MSATTTTNVSDSSNAGTAALRDFVAQAIHARWEDWAKAHPHLAGAIDRVKLIDAGVRGLENDPAFTAAMKQADLDEATLAAAAKALEAAHKVLGAILPGMV
jgi:hypothetical protein